MTLLDVTPTLTLILVLTLPKNFAENFVEITDLGVERGKGNKKKKGLLLS